MDARIRKIEEKFTEELGDYSLPSSEFSKAHRIRNMSRFEKKLKSINYDLSKL